MTIDELIQQAYTNAVAHGWHDEPRSFFEELMLLVTEIAEAGEEYRSHRGLNEIYYRADGKPEGIPVELADLMIRLGDLAGAHSIDLAHALEIKMDFNRTREWRHGGKRI
jgi:NTP pyrophosphatase (non-canonical NTP hydrolase)